jgi:hypothetical protein
VKLGLCTTVHYYTADCFIVSYSLSRKLRVQTFPRLERFGFSVCSITSLHVEGRHFGVGARYCVALYRLLIDPLSFGGT